eukprot:SAG11_NODE_4427_length_1899_cov_0.969444_2_plen_211_part_00
MGFFAPLSATLTSSPPSISRHIAMQSPSCAATRRARGSIFSVRFFFSFFSFFAAFLDDIARCRRYSIGALSVAARYRRRLPSLLDRRELKTVARSLAGGSARRLLSGVAPELERRWTAASREGGAAQLTPPATLYRGAAMALAIELLALLALDVGAGVAGSAARGGLADYAFVSSRVVGRPSWKAPRTAWPARAAMICSAGSTTIQYQVK